MAVGMSAGIIALAVAILAWGSAFVPTKSPSMSLTPPHIVVYQAYITIPIVLTSLFILTFESFEFAPLAFFGAALWIPANMLACSSCRLIGVGIAQSCWAGGICLTSFLWGALGRRLWADEGCTLQNVPLAVLGLLILIAGNTALAFISTMSAGSSTSGTHKVLPEDEGCGEDATSSAPPSAASYELSPVDLTPTDDGEQSKFTQPLVPADAGSQPAPTRAEAVSRRTMIKGLLMCTCGTGILGGTMMVPLKLSPSSINGFLYSLSFALAVGALTAAALTVLTLARVSYQWHPRTISLPAMLNGLLWNLGNIASLVAVDSPLGMTVAYPLSQCALLIAGTWGVLYYREIRGVRPVCMFAAAALVVCAGAALLGLYGSCREDA